MESRADTLVQTVQETLETFSVAPDQGTVLVACSGGPDSVCLLHVLVRLGYRCEVAHFDHQTRGQESADDCAFVRHVAETLDLPFHVDGEDIPRTVSESPDSVEMRARQARYAFFTRLAHERPGSMIATGHQRDDQAETVLLRVVRGTSARGLAGIPPVGNHEGITVLRPLIGCTRAQVVEWLRENQIEFREDSSNVDPDFTRNRLRHALLPFLEQEFNPNVKNALARLAITMRDEDAVMSALAREFTENVRDSEGAFVRKRFARGPRALQRRALKSVARELDIQLGFDHIEAARRFVLAGDTGKKLDLGSGYILYNTRVRTRVTTPDALHSPNGEVAPLRWPGETVALNLHFNVTISGNDVGDIRAACGPERQVFDADAMGAGLAVRYRTEGDRFTPFGMGGAKKLKDYFIDQGLPADERGHTPIVLAGDRIAWVVGHAISDHVAVTPETRRLLIIEVSDAVG